MSVIMVCVWEWGREWFLPFVPISVSFVFCLKLLFNFVGREENKKCLKLSWFYFCNVFPTCPFSPISFNMGLAEASCLSLRPLHQVPDGCPCPYRRLSSLAWKPMEVSPCRIAPKVLLVILLHQTPTFWPSMPFLALISPIYLDPTEHPQHQTSRSAQLSLVMVYTAVP